MLRQRLAQAKCAFTTRRVDMSMARGLLTKNVEPKAGDLVLARVTAVGHHKKIELVDGRRSALYVGDEVVVAYGARYAPDQFEAVVPQSLGACDLVAGGGLAGKVLARHANTKVPTKLNVLGIIADQKGKPLNLAKFALPSRRTTRRPVVIAVVGTSMNAGKTTTACHLVKGLRRAGLKVGAAKVTGTGSGNDLWALTDAGANPVYDFTDAGHASTFQVPVEECVRIALKLIDQVAHAGCEAVVIEVADGLFQAETSALLTTEAFRSRIDALVFAAGDAMGAAYGVNGLLDNQLPGVAISGLVTASPLGLREAAQATQIPVATIHELA
ncbi:MAG: DUF1611 domain-containing protein, partial [Phenylobacterium sp.]